MPPPPWRPLALIPLALDMNLEARLATLPSHHIRIPFHSLAPVATDLHFAHTTPHTPLYLRTDSHDAPCSSALLSLSTLAPSDPTELLITRQLVRKEKGREKKIDAKAAQHASLAFPGSISPAFLIFLAFSRRERSSYASVTRPLHRSISALTFRKPRRNTASALFSPSSSSFTPCSTASQVSTTITTVATHTDTVIMVFQGFGIEASSYNPINLSHGSVAAPLPMAGAGGCSKKRKAFDDLDSYPDATGDFHVRPKLSLPRSAGLVFNGDAQFHALPADVNQAMLAQLGHNPFTGSSTSGSTFVTPSSSSSSGFLAGAMSTSRPTAPTTLAPLRHRSTGRGAVPAHVADVGIRHPGPRSRQAQLVFGLQQYGRRLWE
ncbi:hypothetical protein L1887_54660 [Cichorium endivia]|nr:hypothetical protein L1887_54660 [Cichorium endivia]